MATNIGSENLSSKPQSLNTSFAISNKGKPLLIYENYLFKCNKTTASKTYWMCTERQCNVYIHTSLIDQLICVSGGHNHSSNPDQIEAKLLRDKMKERILTETTSITKIYDEEIAKVNLSKAATAILPTIVEYRMYH